MLFRNYAFQEVNFSFYMFAGSTSKVHNENVVMSTS